MADFLRNKRYLIHTDIVYFKTIVSYFFAKNLFQGMNVWNDYTFANHLSHTCYLITDQETVFLLLIFT